MKYFIWGDPGKVPDRLDNKNTTSTHPMDAQQNIIHEFDADTFDAACAYFKGYVARWTEAPDVFGDVLAFHQVMDHPHPAVLERAPGEDLIALRERLILEEVNDELLPALIQLRHAASTEAVDEQLIAIADSIADAIYVIVGTGIVLGIPLGRVWDEVQRSNMAKYDSKTGKVKRREDGKILKPDDWTPPDVASVLGLNKD